MKADDEKPPFPDIGFGEALRRFVQTNPKELPSSIGVAGKAEARSLERSKTPDAKADPPVARKKTHKVGKDKEVGRSQLR